MKNIRLQQKVLRQFLKNDNFSIKACKKALGAIEKLKKHKQADFYMVEYGGMVKTGILKEILEASIKVKKQEKKQRSFFYKIKHFFSRKSIIPTAIPTPSAPPYDEIMN